MAAEDSAGNILPLHAVLKQHGYIVIGHGVFGQMLEAVGTGTVGRKRIHIQLEEHHIQILDAAGHGGFLVQQSQIADFFLTQEDVQPDHIVCPHRLFRLPQMQCLHVGIACHVLNDALRLAEQRGNILGAVREGTGDVTALRGQQLVLIVGGGVIGIPEDLSVFKEGELGVVTLILRHGLAQVGQQGGADESLVGGGRRGQGQNAGGVLQNGVYELVGHPGIGKDLLHPTADGQILLDAALQLLIQLVDGAVKGGGDGSGLEVLVPVHPGHFLHDVGLNGHITGGAPGGDDDMHIVTVKGQFITQRA